MKEPIETHELLAWLERWRGDSREMMRWGINAEEAYGRIEKIIKEKFRNGRRRHTLLDG